MLNRLLVTVTAVAFLSIVNASVVWGQTPPAQPRQAGWWNWQPLGGRLIVSISGAVQTGPGDIDRTGSFELYEEEAQLETRQDIDGGALLDIGAAYRYDRSYGAGLTYTRTSSLGDATLSGSVPHPLFFGRPRPFTAAAAGLRRTEQALHFQGVYWMPFIEKVDIAFSLGPSLFIVKQALPRGVNVIEIPPDFNTVLVENADVAAPKELGLGFNIGADMTYQVTRRIAGGLLLRYSRGTADLDTGGGGEVSTTTGGLQIGAGVRVQF